MLVPLNADGDADSQSWQVLADSSHHADLSLPKGYWLSPRAADLIMRRAAGKA